MFFGSSLLRLRHGFFQFFAAAICPVLIALGAAAAPDGSAGVQHIGESAIFRTSDQINKASAATDAEAKVHGKKMYVLAPGRNKKDRVEVPLTYTVVTNTELPPPSYQLTPSIATPSINFTAATVNDCTGYPPDTMGTVGPTQFIIALNGRIRSFNKVTGVKDNAIDADTDVFFSSVQTPPTSNNFTTDPRIRYDRISKRWFIIMIDVPGQSGSLPNRIMLAVSDSSVITSSSVWSFYQFQGDSSNFADYPTLGIDANALYIGCNMFSASSGAFVNCNGYVVRKSSLLSGGPIVVTTFANLITGSGTRQAGPYTPQGVDNFDPSATEGYFIGVDFASPTLLQLRRVSNPGGTPTISANIGVTINSFASPINPTIKGSTNAIDGLDERLLAAHLRNGSLWTAHNVGVNSTGGTSSVDRDAVRWYQITNIPTGLTPAVVQSGTVYQSGSTVMNYWMGTIMVSGQGHAALGCTMGGPSHYMDAVATGRYATDTLGTMQTPFTYTTSSAAYNPNDLSASTDPHRWGDYSMTSLDPNDDMTMWTVQEWVSFSQNGFAVQVAKLPAPPPATPVSCSPSTIVIGATTNIVVTGTSSSGSGFFDPGTGFSNHIAAAINGGGLTVNSITYTDPTHITLNVTAAANATGGARTITVTNPDGQSITSSGILTVSTTAATKLTIQTQPSSTATAGVAFATQPVIRIEDANGILQTNDNSTVVTATRSAGAGTLQGATTATAVGGLVTFTNLSHYYATNITIAFSANFLISATSSVVAVGPAAFSQLQILVPGQTSTPTVSPGRTGTPTAHVSGTPFNVTVNAVDAFWNFVNNVTDTVSLSSSDGIALLPSNTALSAGTANLNVTLKTVGTQSLSASDASQGGIGIDVSPGISITPATLIVVGSNASRVYGQTNPVFGGTLTGVESGDNITASFNSSATTNSAKGNYAIVPSLSDPNNRLGNYTVLSTNGTLTVIGAPLTVACSNATRFYGQTNPVLSGSIVGLQNNDNITATFTTVATTNSNVGPYLIWPILADPNSKLSNYLVTTNNANLTVTNAPLVVTANNASRVWGATNPVLTGTIAGLVNNDNITAAYSTTATTNSAVGTYPVTVSLSDTNSKLPNYTVTTNNGTLTIVDHPPTISPLADQVTSVGSTVSLTVAASDPDQPYQNLTYTLDPGAPSGANIDSNTGAFSWTATAGSQGTTNTVTVRVTDNAIPSQDATASFHITVIQRPQLVDIVHNAGDSVSLIWSVVPGATYSVQFKNALTDATWTELGQVTATDATLAMSHKLAEGQDFYRLVDGYAVSDPAGVIPLTLLGNSDSYISLPFTRPIAGSGAVASTLGNVVSVIGANWSPGQFVYSAVQSNNFYARFDSGALEGRTYNVLTNDSNTLTLDLGTDTLDAVAAGDTVSIIPHWSLNSAFPNGDGILTSPAPGNRYTEILVPDTASTGINLSATKVYYFNAGTWKQVGQGAINRGDDLLPLNSYFIVRQNVATNTTMNSVGAVVVPKLSLQVRAQATNQQDNSVGLVRASAVTLNNSGLITSGAFSASPLPGSRTDELLTFDNSIAQKNKSSSAIYYYWSNAWRRVGSGTTDFGGTAVFTPGTGIIIRKATNEPSVIWTNAP